MLRTPHVESVVNPALTYTGVVYGYATKMERGVEQPHNAQVSNLP